MSIFSTNSFTEMMRGQGEFRHYGSTEKNFHVFSSHKNEEAIQDNTKKNDKTEQQKKREEYRKMREKKYKAYGIRQEAFADTLSKDRLSTLFDNIESNHDNYRTQYCRKLTNGELKNDFFTPIDGDIYSLVEAFYNTEYCTPDSEVVIIELMRHFNVLNRQIQGRPADGEEKKGIKSINQSYSTGMIIKSGLFKKQSRNVLKEVAWCVTHSVLTGMLLSDKQIYRIVPKGEYLDCTTAWNNYINLQSDVPDAVKNLFIIDDMGKCIFREVNKNRFSFNPGGPKDDIPVDDDDSDVIEIDLDEATEEQLRRMDEQCAEAIARDDERDRREAKRKLEKTPADQSNMVAEAAAKEAEVIEKAVKESGIPADQQNTKMHHAVTREFTFGQLYKKNHSTSVNPAKVAETMMGGNVVNPSKPLQDNIESAPVEAIHFTKDELKDSNTEVDFIVKAKSNNDYTENNNSFASSVPRLNRFTTIVNDEGYKVFYSVDLINPGFIKARIEDQSGHIVRILSIDNCNVYGDTLRIATMDNVEGSIVQSTFIPVSKEGMIRSAINGTLKDEHRKSLIKNFPKSLYDKGYTFNFFDRVDMSGLSYVGKDGKTIAGLPFDTWLATVTNINKVIFSNKLPVIRFRIVNYKDPEHFQLVADNHVKYPFPTKIKNLQTNIDAINNGTTIIFDGDDIRCENVAVYNR